MTFDVTAALTWVDAGCSVIPIKSDGTKAPIGSWKAAMAARAHTDVVTGYARIADGIGVVCGHVSGNLEMLELEGRAITEGVGQQFREACRDNGIEHVLDALMDGCLTQSPSGGYHLWYRVDGPARRNTKLARRPATPTELDEKPDEKVKVLIETRGEGGFAVVPPSAGPVHPTGNPWIFAAGSPTTIPTIGVEERDALHAVAALLDQMPIIESQPPVISLGPAGTGEVKGGRPGDDYNSRATWDDILTPHGWTKARPLGGGWAWRRPGKTDPGISATTGQAQDADRLYVFTTSTEFESERPYDKFAAYSLLEHGGDFRAAGRELRRLGYGDQSSPGPPSAPTPLLGASTAMPSSAPTDGNLALVHDLGQRRSDGAGGPPPGAPSPTGERHRGQLRMAERLVTRHADHLRYAHGIGWHRWDGARWAADEDGAPIRAAIDTVKAAYTDLPGLDSDDRKALFQDIGKVESAAGIAGMLTLSGSILPLATAPSRLDANPYLFNLPSGTLDLYAGEVRPHDRADLITRVAGADIAAPEKNPENMPTNMPTGMQEAASTWDGFLRRVLPDKDVRLFVQRLFGYALLGKVTEHVMPIFTGTGANGKGTLRDAVLAAFGDYAVEVDPRLLMESKHERHSTELMELRGRRLVFCSETEKGRRFAEATMKRLVGGDPIQARRMHKDPITFLPAHTLVMLTNHLPSVSGDDPAVWRRVLVVPFDVVIPPEERDGDLPEKLRAAAPAVLRWIHEGWLAYQRDGLAPPEAVRARTEEYRADSDALGRFVDERCTINTHAFARARELYAAYVQWCNTAGERHATETEFAKSMTARGQQKVKSAAGMVYRGIGLLSTDEDQDDENDRR